MHAPISLCVVNTFTTPTYGPEDIKQTLLSDKMKMDTPNTSNYTTFTSTPTPQVQQESLKEMRVAQALETARESSDGLSDPATFHVITTAYQAIWAKIRAQPDSYTMTMSEFPVFNFFQHLHKGDPEVELLAREATARFWACARAPDYKEPSK